MTDSSPFLPENWKELTAEQLVELLQWQERQQYALGLKPRPWRSTARNKQLPPDDPKHSQASEGEAPCGCNGTDDAYQVFLIMAGRGWGKSLSGSNFLIEQALKPENAGRYFAAVGPTFAEVSSVMFNGPTGIRKQLLPGEEQDFNINANRLTLYNGSIIQGYSADVDQKVRGANLAGCWCDEIRSWRWPEFYYEALLPALRIGDNPRMIITTSPAPTRIIKDLVSRRDGTVHVTTGAMYENQHLAESVKANLRRRFEGTRAGRTEIEGLLLEDLEGALFVRSDLEDNRISRNEIPELQRVVVAIDPSMNPAAEESDETGIVVVGEANGHAYIVDDKSLRASPDTICRTAASAYYQWGCDTCVIESNQGGQWLVDAMRHVDSNVRVRTVHGRVSKVIRAEPVAVLSETGRLHLCGSFPELEDELMSLVPGEKPHKSPGRADACVWATMELRGLSMGSYFTALGCWTCACGETAVGPRCARCGTVQEAPASEAPPPGGPPSPADAYTKVCENPECKRRYPTGAPRCVYCKLDPLAYLKRVDEWRGSKPTPKTPGLRGMWRRGVN